jgi:LAO/AO transport system kinase
MMGGYPAENGSPQHKIRPAGRQGGIIASVTNSPLLARSGDILARLRSGDLRALSRAISIVEDGAAGATELLAACRSFPSGALRIGVTGPPGAGKSTLVDCLVRSFRGQGKAVGVLAVDPSSPYTGGALLGDRIRMQGYAGDQGVYFRSMATRGATGGLTAAAAAVCEVMEAAGRQIVLIETVGAGQAEIEIASLADVTLLVLVPGMGDEVQSLKAGIMEIADIFVVNKADLDGADRAEREIVAMQALGKQRPRQGIEVWLPPVVRTVATAGEGVDKLVAQIEQFVAACPPNRQSGAEKPVPGSVQSLMDHPQLDHIGIAVRSIAEASGFYASLGIPTAHEETVEHEQVKTAMLPLGDTRIELLEPTAEDSTIGRFLAKRGPGPHHLAIRLGGIDALFDRLRAEGVRLASDRIRTGAGGHRYFFIHPASTGGVLLEIVGDSAEPDAPQPAGPA